MAVMSRVPAPLFQLPSRGSEHAEGFDSVFLGASASRADTHTLLTSSKKRRRVCVCGGVWVDGGAGLGVRVHVHVLVYAGMRTRGTHVHDYRVLVCARARVRASVRACAPERGGMRWG